MGPAESERLLAGRYRLRSVIGRGGMGLVWRARDELLGRDVAVKEIVWPPQMDAAEWDIARRRAVREAQMAARLSHPNVVAVYDIIEEDSRPWLVVELVPHRSLRDAIMADGPLSPGQAARVGLGILAALRAAHDAGIVHRDVKPANVLLAPEGRVVLTDFGIARATDSPALTGTGVLVGSPSYISPERARGENRAAPGDLWALGACLYAAVEGRPPFDRDGALASLTAVVTDEPDPPSRAGPLWPVISGLLRKDPDARLGADEVERMLQRISRRVAPRSAPPFPGGFGRAGRGQPHRGGHRRRRSGLGRHPAPPGGGFGLSSLQPGTEDVRPAVRVTIAAPVRVHVRLRIHPGGASALPAGYYRFTNSTGFSIGVPTGWQISHVGHYVYVRDPANSGIFLLIDQSDQPEPNALADWRQQAAARQSSYPDYHLIRLQAVSYPQAEQAADWEFTYDRNGTIVHILNRNVLANTRHAYALYWSTPENDWNADYHYFAAFAVTFRPAGVNQG